MRRKGIELAGGSGTRLHPSNQGESTQTLPVYDKPMIDDPLSTPHDQLAFERLLGDGAAWGMTIRYPLQPSPDGLAQAFLIGAEFLAGAPAALVLGDNLFHGHDLVTQLEASRFTSNPEMGLFMTSAVLDFLRLEREAFAGCPSVAIDVAVMEKTDRDIHEDAHICYLRSEHRLVVGLGVEDLVVVETDDVVLVAHRDRAQDIKGIVGLLEKEGAPESKAHRRIYRPWGSYDGVTEGERWQVKKIVVNPGASLSLQLHHHRAEHWIVVKGTAVVEKDGTEELVGENQSTFILLGCRHRLSNPGRIPLEMIEVQSGPYLGENDIVRFEDLYGRSDELSSNHKLIQ